MASSTKALRGGEFIIRETNPVDVFIPEDFNDDQRMVRQMCMDFVAEMGERAHILEEQVGLMNKAGELGLLGAHIPEKYGGNPLDTNSNTLMSEELGRAGGSFDTTYAAHIGIGMLPILYFGNEDQKQKFLPGVLMTEGVMQYSRHHQKYHRFQKPLRPGVYLCAIQML